MNWLDKETTSEDREEEIRRALGWLTEKGPNRDKKLAVEALAARTTTSGCVGRGEPLPVIWGKREQLIDCAVEELSVGALKFHLIDYGDELDLSVDTLKQLRAGNSVENNQCAIIAFGAGIEWYLQGRPNRVPSKSRVKRLARELRALELKEAIQLNIEAEEQPRQLTSAAHDVLSYAHDRDIRCFHWFLLPAVRSFVECSVRVLEVGSNSMSAIAHVFEVQADKPSIYLLAHKGHLRWALPTEYTRPAEWKNWETNVSRVIRQPSDDWKQWLAVADYDYLPDYVRCKFCPSWVKADLPGWGAGGVSGEPNSLLAQSTDPTPSTSIKPPPSMRRHSTDGILQRGEGVERFAPPTVYQGRPPSIPAPTPSKPCPPMPPTKPSSTSSYVDSRMLPGDAQTREAFALLGSVDSTGTGEQPELFPVKSKEWRVKTPHQLAYGYHARLNQPYSVENLLWVIRAGTELMTALGSFVLACRHAREINFRKLENDRYYLESKRTCFPAVSEEIDDIYRLGVCTPFSETRSKGYDSGMPIIEKGVVTSLKVCGEMCNKLRCSWLIRTKYRPPKESNRVQHIPPLSVIRIEVGLLNSVQSPTCVA